MELTEGFDNQIEQNLSKERGEEAQEFVDSRTGSLEGLITELQHILFPILLSVFY